MAGMIGVEEARALIERALSPLPGEEIGLAAAPGRTLADAVLAKMSQPPFAASAMDGYAVRLSDCAEGARLRVVGESSAGARFDRTVAANEAVRIFTGAAAPQGADHVLIQEEAARDGGEIVVLAAQEKARNIRPAGVDFRVGDELCAAGDVMTGPRLALAAAGNIATLSAVKKPRVALIANGDELALPGASLSPDQIVCSIPFGLAPMIAAWGGEADFLGIAPDDPTAIRRLAERGLDYDLIVPIGGASVGDRDFMHAAFSELGLEMIFAKVAMKPGKPTWFGRMGAASVIGLPGNPASAIVAAVLFVRPALARLLGRRKTEGAFFALAAAALPANGARESFLRARLSCSQDGARLVSAFESQDSSLLSVLAGADALIRRAPRAPAVAAGGAVECVPM